MKRLGTTLAVAGVVIALVQSALTFLALSASDDPGMLPWIAWGSLVCGLAGLVAAAWSSDHPRHSAVLFALCAFFGGLISLPFFAGAAVLVLLNARQRPPTDAGGITT